MKIRKITNSKISYAIYIVLATFLMVGCGNNVEKKSHESEKEGVGRTIYSYGWNTKIRVVNVDDCEYIIIDSGTKSGTSIIHKENCENH